MKLTWFGGTTIRVHIGGEIVVVDADAAPAGIERAELLGGASHAVGIRNGGAAIDAAGWRRRAVPTLLDAGAAPAVLLHRIGDAAVIVDAAGEPPLVLLGADESPRFGRWADGAVVVLMSEADALIAAGSQILEAARPRLLALAADEAAIDLAIGALAGQLDGAGLVALERGLALEV